MGLEQNLKAYQAPLQLLAVVAVAVVGNIDIDNIRCGGRLKKRCFLRPNFTTTFLSITFFDVIPSCDAIKS